MGTEAGGMPARVQRPVEEMRGDRLREIRKVQEGASLQGAAEPGRGA